MFKMMELMMEMIMELMMEIIMELIMEMMMEMMMTKMMEMMMEITLKWTNNALDDDDHHSICRLAYQMPQTLSTPVLPEATHTTRSL